MDPNNQNTEQTNNVPEGFPTLAQQVENTQEEKPAGKRKKKRSVLVTLIRIIVSVLIIAVGIYVILYLVARAAKYDSIPAMIRSMLVELDLMWQRILY